MDNKYGLVLDGELAVGKFVFSTNEDKSGQRQIMKLDLNLTYVDVTNGRTKHPLRCMIVEKIPDDQVQNMPDIPNPICIKILEDFGMGIIEGKVLFDNSQAHYQKALFVKNPIKLNPKLN